MAYCTLFCVLHTIQCTSHHMAYCTLHSTLYTAHYNIPGDLTQAKTTPHSSSLFLQTRDVQLSQKCILFSVLIIIQYVKRRVVCSAPYSLQYSILNTLKNLYLNFFGGEQLKISPLRITLTVGHCTAHYMAFCTLYGVLLTTQHTVPCTAHYSLHTARYLQT